MRDLLNKFIFKIIINNFFAFIYLILNNKIIFYFKNDLYSLSMFFINF